MKARSTLGALVLLTAVLAVLPSGQAIETPPQCQTIGSPCCGIEPAFAPCCTVLSCPPQPRCSETGIHTSDLLSYLGPHASAELHADCTLSVAEAGTVCPSVAPEPQAVARDLGPAEVSAQVCGPRLDCTCDPILAE